MPTPRFHTRSRFGCRRAPATQAGRRAWLAAALVALLEPAAAQPVPSAPSVPSIQLAGRMGDRALLVIDGRSQMLEPGQSAGGLRLVRWQEDVAVVEQAGRTLMLRVGAAPAQMGGAAAPSGARTIVIPAGGGGHFITEGAINGRRVRFMVDTGATVIAIPADEAARLGIDAREGKPAVVATAGGNVTVRAVTLGRVRVGEVEVASVQAVVIPTAMPYVLLGNSFLDRFQMRRENDVMRLELR